MALEKHNIKSNGESNIRKIKMIVVDGGVNVLLKDLGFPASGIVRGSDIIYNLRRSYLYVCLCCRDRDAHSRKPLVITVRTSSRKLALMSEQVSPDQNYVISFHNSTDIEIVNRWHWQASKKDESVGVVGVFGESRLMWLPLELKLRILHLLPGSDLARVACVCSELKSLCDSEHLWMQKYRETFGYHISPESLTLWKQKFAVVFKYLKHLPPLSLSTDLTVSVLEYIELVMESL